MNDFARLGVGILLLGLAIYLSLNIDSAIQNDQAPVPLGEPQVVPTNQTVLDSKDWQAPSPAKPDGSGNTRFPPQRDSITAPLVSSNLNDEIDAPDFQKSSFITKSKQLAGTIEPDRRQFTHPPRIANEYQANSSLNINRKRRQKKLTPIRPKPAFANHRPIVQQFHAIRDGDTLQSIAREYFGAADRYLEIYMLNRDVLSNPARLPKDVQLKIPGR